MDPTLVARCVSPSGNRSVLIYSATTTATTEAKPAQLRLELYEGSILIHRIESTSHSLPHGSILVGDVTFGSPSFGGSDEDYFVYTAERLPPPSTAYWNNNNNNNDNDNNNNNNNIRGTQHVLGKGISEQWG